MNSSQNGRQSLVALIPARGGSKRVPGKNIRRLGGHPLIAYAICGARSAGIFDAVIVSTDDAETGEIARRYGAEVPFLRPAELAADKSPDIDWIEDVLKRLSESGRAFDCFSILRPTSPFRSAESIRRAWEIFQRHPGAHSLRAVRPCSEHPGKMWVIRGEVMYPLMPMRIGDTPWHSNQYAALPEIYVQTASLEIARTDIVTNGRSIAGEIVIPFVTEGNESVDVNTPTDWEFVEFLLERGKLQLPTLEPVD
jgi:N-acylneuraminate cytidylyltransferase